MASPPEALAPRWSIGALHMGSVRESGIAGGSSGEGTSPVSATSSDRSPGRAIGTAENSASVYGGAPPRTATWSGLFDDLAKGHDRRVVHHVAHGAASRHNFAATC